MEREEEHPPEDVCWVQPTDSLAFSVSPVGPSTNIISPTDEESDNDEKSTPEQNADQEEDYPLKGEYIWGGRGDPDTEKEEVGEIHRSAFDDNEVRSPGQRGSPTDEGVAAFGDAAEDFGDAEVPGDSEHRPFDSREGRGHQHQQHGERISDSHGTSPESPRAIDEDNNGESVDGDVVALPHNAPPVHGFVEPEWDAGDNNGWVDDEEDFAPAWDQGVAADTLGLDVDGEQDESPASRHELDSTWQQDQHYAALDFDGSSDHAMDHISDEEVSQSSLGRDEWPLRVVRRRTRLSLDKERRRLDHVPRSQRLSQVKGHPLGGMTLLELEERHLLDVGIGQMTRQLEKTRGRGGARRADTDLLRRSARLLRRAQQERDSRLNFAENREHHRHETLSCARGVSGIGLRAGGVRKDGRRPASASREHRRAVSSSFSLEAEENNNWIGARGGRVGCKGTQGYTAESPPPVGLYSGGGIRCSLKQRRPMSAKPALTCGSGWEPGRTRPRRRAGEQHEFANVKGARFRGVTNVGAGGLDDQSDNGSEMSDLSPHGIVEYTDEEEGPFNVDELERVAASYLLHRRGSIRCSSAGVDDRFADDGSVYIYRECDGSGDAAEVEEQDEGGAGGRRHTRERVDCRAENEDHYHWQKERREASPSVRTRDNGNVTERQRTNSDGDCRSLPRQLQATGGSSTSVRGQAVGADKRRGERDTRMKPRPYSGGLTLSSGDIAAVMRRSERGGTTTTKLRQRPASADVGPQRKGLTVGGSEGHARGSYLSTGGREGARGGGALVLIDDCSASLDHGGQVEAPPEMLVPAPGATYSPKVNSGLQSSEHDRTHGAMRGDAVEHGSAKIKQLAVRLREMILDRQASASRSMRQVFCHFDRRGCGYVNAAEMREALVDLRLHTSPTEAKELHSVIALDGGDRVSYAEFAVFVSDPYHSELQAEVCQQAAEQLEVLGRRSFNLDAAFTSPPFDTTKPRGGSGTDQRAWGARGGQYFGGSAGRGAEQGGESKVVPTTEFLAGLDTLSLRLSASDAQRLLVRFDVHGDGYLSVGRFIAMVESSRPWTRALARLAHQEEVDEEADACLRTHRTSGRWPAGLSTEIAEMARYLGIRVSSDAPLLWIATDALAAPLPDGWVVYEGREGRWFYHNELAGEYYAVVYYGVSILVAGIILVVIFLLVHRLLRAHLNLEMKNDFHIFRCSSTDAGQSRWDHPSDPHFRRVYMRERFGMDHAEVEFGHEPMERSKATGRNRGVGAVSRGPGGAHVNSSRLPGMLPPRRMRPKIRDFPAAKALDNLRTRRLNENTGSMTTESLAGAGATRPLSVSPRINPAQTDPALWTERASGPPSPRGPRRRRPVSASALREGVEERSLGLKTTADGSSGGGGGGGFERATIAGGLYAGSRVGRDGAARRLAVANSRRPRSAKAALQRASTDRQSTDDRHGDPQDDHRQSGTVTYRSTNQSRHSPLVASEHIDERWVAQEGNAASGLAEASTRTDQDDRRGLGGGVGSLQETDKPKARQVEGRTAVSEYEEFSSGGDSMDMSTATEEERAWLLERLAGLCAKLENAEMLSRGGHQISGANRNSRGLNASGRARLGRSRADVFGGSVGVVPETLDNLAGGKEPTRNGAPFFRQQDGKNKRPNEKNSALLLHHQVVELESRIRNLETRLHDPPRPEVYSPSPGSSNHRGTVTAAAARTARGRRDAPPRRGSHGGRNKRNSQDDLTYVTTGRQASGLSKQSWPLPSGAVVNGMGAPNASSRGSSSSGESLVFAGASAEAPRVPPWDLGKTRGGRGDGSRGRSGDRLEDGRRPRRKGRSRGGGNPPGIVLI